LSGYRERGYRVLRCFIQQFNNQLTLLAYNYEHDILTLTLLALGSHEIFNRDLKTIKTYNKLHILNVKSIISHYFLEKLCFIRYTAHQISN
jgi:hypothetical protein